jgi:hypothetical protein
MHASIWKFTGDPGALAAAYDAMLAEIPLENMRLHICLSAPDGILMIDTCPSKDAFHGFVGAGWFQDLCARHGLPEPDAVDDYPVHLALVDGAVRA